MIKANELRKGNHIYYGINEKIVQAVETIHKEGINEEFSFDEDYPESEAVAQFYKFEDLEGIPLTSKTLKEIGCTQSETDKGMWRNSQGVWLLQIGNKNKYYIQGFRSGHYIEYLHQYQNCVYFFTGEELEIKLDFTASGTALSGTSK